MRPNKLTPNENLRWQSSRMMLPEHVERLQELDVEREKKKKPVLDEQEQEQINETLHIAMEYNLPLVFTVWIDGFFEEIEGAVHFIDQQQKRVHVVDIREQVHKIDFEAITEVEYAE